MKEITHIGKNGFPIPITPPMPEAVLAEDFDYSMYIQNLIDTAPYIDIEKLLYSKEETSTLPFEYLFDKYLNDIITIQTIYEDDLKENVTSIDYNKAMKDIARNYLDSLKKQINYKIDRKKKIKSLMTKRKYLISKLKLPLRKDNKTASFKRIDAFINREIPLGKLYYSDLNRALQSEVYKKHKKNLEEYKRHILANLKDSEGIYTKPIENLHFKGKNK